jgi:hypothetical protein
MNLNFTALKEKIVLQMFDFILEEIRELIREFLFHFHPLSGGVDE